MKTILVVEDDKTLRENIAVFLNEENYNVLMAEDGLDGIQKTIKSLPDLILCDINMPNMNGYDFFKTIQQISYTSSIPFIFLTARAEKEDIRIGMHLGVDDYITKPFDFDELLKVIKIRLEKYEKIHHVIDVKFMALVDNPVVGVYIYQNEKIIYYNDTLANIFGFTHDEFAKLGYDEAFDELITEAYDTNVLENLKKAVNDVNRNINLQFRAIHKTKEEVPVEMYGSVVNYKGVSSIIGTMMDISKHAHVHSLKQGKSVNPDMFTKREIEVLELICKGMTTNQVSDKLFISNRTVDTHRANLLAKSACKNTAELIIYASKNKLVQL